MIINEEVVYTEGKDNFDYALVLDFEANCRDKSLHPPLKCQVLIIISHLLGND